ncbi:MAG: O-methyltransferase, partial [Actinobacteria bacterium]|nr:O-methyltransferase [Actinomycetota bacterium]
MNPEERIWQLMQGLMHTQALHVVAELGIADELAGGPQPLDALAARAGADAGALHRFLRALASDGIFVEHASGTWANTETSE